MCWALRNGKPPDPWSTATSTGTVGTVYDAGAGPGGASGRLVTVTDQAGVARTNVQDALGRLVGVSEGCTGCITTYTYDVLDNLRTVTQGAQQRTFAFDSLKRLSGATNPEDGATNYSSYDSQGNLLAKTHVGDVTTNYAYDAQNRVTSKSYTSRTYTDGAVATPSAVYCYDGNVVNTSITCSAASPAIPYSIGRLTGSGNSVSVTKYASYDALGRVTASQQTPNGQSAYQFSYTYNPAGGLTSITYPSNRTVSYLYDAAGRASAAKNGAANSTDNYATIGSYWPHGAVNQMTLGNTQTETSVYNDRLQPASLTVSGNLLALNYYYCTNLVLSCTTNNGNLMSEVIGAGKYGLNLTQNFTYDGVNRLLTGTETGTGGWSQTQGYDQWGNRWLASYNGLPPPSTSVPDATAFPGTNGNNNRMSLSGVAYDTAANLQLFNTADLRYDAENRLVKATKNSTVYTYGYDCEGRRVARTSPNGTTTYVYDAQGQLAAEYGPAVENPDSGRRYLTADHLGSTRLVTDANGNDVVRYDYLPFGEEITVGTHGRTSVMGYGAATGGKLEFTGKERDAETGLDYFGARYLSSAQGRWLSPDWSVNPQPVPYANLADPQTLNLYSYVRNNPLSQADADGHCPGCDELARRLMTWATVGVATQGGKKFAANVGIGMAKGAGSFALNTVKSLAAGSQALTNPSAAASMLMSPAPKALQTDNQTQSEASTYTQAALTIGAVYGPAAFSSTSELTTVTHFTNDFGVDMITGASGVLRGGGATTGTFVAPAGEIPAGATSSQVESLLEVGAGKGTNSITFETPTSNLVVPGNGQKTSGQVTQFQLKEPVQIDPTKFKKTNE
jgi:RHS repeat-associated protein